MSNTATVDPERRAQDPAWFRYVLGQYPTGVTLITAREEAGNPVGMIVGTFTSVSLDPPLVGFLPDVRSSTWPKIRTAGSFCASVLTAAQQDICRAFARKQDDRFELGTWIDTPGGGIRLDGAAAWVDCVIHGVMNAGDHDIVLGRVTALDVGHPTALPLLFLRGGYGSFSIPSLMSPETRFTAHVRAADLARPQIEALAADLNLECLVSVVVDDAVVVISAAGVSSSPSDAPTRVGISFDLAAPFAPVHVAWAREEAQKRWLARARDIMGRVDVDSALVELENVRKHGYAVSSGKKAAADFERAVHLTSDSLRPDLSGVLPDVLSRAGSGPASLAAADEVTSLHAPVFGPDGQVLLSLTLNGFSGNESPTRLQDCLDRLLATASRLTTALDGTSPLAKE